MAQEQRFELVSTLGRGGMAEVFLGWMNSVGGLRRNVAIKRILPELIQKQGKLFQQMFVDEARLAFQLEHDNIVRVYDVGQTANTFSRSSTSPKKRTGEISSCTTSGSRKLQAWASGSKSSSQAGRRDLLKLIFRLSYPLTTAGYTGAF